jgi:hypothetical protein
MRVLIRVVDRVFAATMAVLEGDEMLRRLQATGFRHQVFLLKPETLTRRRLTLSESPL